MGIQSKIPNLFIIGAPKCGTTAMIYYLSKHPEIYVSKIKEPHYFNTDSKHRYFFDQNKYLSLFKPSNTDHKYLVEGSVWYLYSKVAVQNILNFNSEAKFIVMLRNPVDMFYSLHQELYFGGNENIKSPKKAWDIQNERFLGNKIPFGCLEPELLQYGEVCKLGVQSKNVKSLIPPKNLKFVLLDEIIENPSKVFMSVLDFLGVQQIDLSSYEIVNQKKIRRSQMLSRVFIIMTELKRKLGIYRGFGLANAINKLNVSHGESLNNYKQSLFNEELLEYFREDIKLLELVINKDLSNWIKMKNL